MLTLQAAESRFYEICKGALRDFSSQLPHLCTTAPAFFSPYKAHLDACMQAMRSQHPRGLKSSKVQEIFSANFVAAAIKGSAAYSVTNAGFSQGGGGGGGGGSSGSSASANASALMANAPAPLRCWAEGCKRPSTSACGRCRTAEYCGAPCQRAHWRAHKQRCKELEAAADAAGAVAEAAAAAAAAAPAGGAGVQPPGAPRTPGVYSGLECRVQDYHCALVGCSAALEAGGAGLVCSGCRAVVYCDVECQAVHWAAAHMEACFVAVANRVQGGDVHQGDDGGEYVLRDMLHVCKTRFGAADERTLQCVSVLGEMMQGQGRLAEAGALYKECLAARRAALGPEHPDTLDSMRHLASLLHAQGSVGEAEALMRYALDAARATLGPRHGLTLTFMCKLASMLEDQGRLRKAQALYSKALMGRCRLLGRAHPDTLGACAALVRVLTAQGKVGHVNAVKAQYGGGK